jgi:23S rRNA (uracil1939-C5)-methyltransferase
MLKINQLIEAEITEVAFGGDGVSRQEGQVLFTPFTLPGEKVLVRVEEAHRSYARGRVKEIVRPSPLRVAAPCPHYGSCGGCRYQHMPYEEELKLKQRQVEETLRRIGKFEDPAVRPIIGSPESYGYRNRISLHVEEGRAGFRGVDPRDFVPIKACLLASEGINATLARQKPRSGRPGKPAKWMIREAPETHGGFQQVNRFLGETLRGMVRAAFDGGSGRLLEAYSGDGFFTSALAEVYSGIACVEWDSRAAEHAGRTLPSHVKIINAPCETGLAEAWEQVKGGNPPDGLLDPPRVGLSKEVRAFLAGHPMGRLAYLSCNPATLARDLRELAELYRVDYFQPIDMFPRTAHVECLAVCSLR